MESLGKCLKSAREQKNITLEEIARETRIPLRHLMSIEEGRFGALPGGMYNRAFLKTYCGYVGIDPEPILARYEEEAELPKEKSIKVKPPVPRTEPPFKFHPLAAWSLMLLVSVTGLYFSRHWVTDVFSPYFSHTSAPGIEVSPSPAPAPPPVSEPKQIPSTAAPVIQAASQTTPAQTSGMSPISSAAQSEMVPVSPGTIRLEFEVLEQCWVSVNRDGDRVMVKVLKPGDDQSFNASGRFFLVLGNAAGVRLKINGHLVKPLGRPGEVVRLTIDEQNIKDLVEKTSD